MNQTEGSSITVELDRRVNFAMQQNDVPVVKAVHIENPSADALRDLRLRITAQPEFADVCETRIEAIAPGAAYSLPSVDLILSPSYLREVTERTRGQLRFEIFQGGARIAENVETLDILARDEWSGLASRPEILAAFVMPNHPVIRWTGRTRRYGPERPDHPGCVDHYADGWIGPSCGSLQNRGDQEF